MADTSNLTQEQLKEIAKQQAKITAEQEKQKQLSGDLADTYDEIENSLDSISKLINNQLKNQGASARQVSEIKSIYNSLNKTNKELQYLNDKFYEGTLKTKDISKQLVQLDRTETSIRRQINIAYDKGNKTLAAKFEKELRILELEREEAKELKKQNEYVDKRVGLTGKLLSGLEKLPIIGESIDFGEINTNMRLAAGNSNVFAAGLKTAGAQLKEGLKDPLVQFALFTAFYAKIIKSATEFDELNTKTGRTLGINKEQALELYNASFKYAASSKDSFVTAKRLTEAQQSLNTVLGTSVNLGDKNAEGFARLTHYYGLNEDSAAKLNEAAVEQGQTSLDLLKTTTKTFGIQKAQNGGTISLNKVLEKVANVSNDIFIKFKGNTQAIAAAVMESDRLGLSLEQSSQIADSLLNFESSIENELKAELLTGKAINLEKARQYALSGDTLNLTKEVAKEVGGIHEFEKMNVIQRKAYAEAFGMSVEDMAKMLRKQEFEAKLAGSTAKSAKEKLEYAEKNNIAIDDALRAEYEQKSLADEQKELFTKLNEIIGKITKGPMNVLFHQMEKILGFVSGMISGLGKMTGGPLGNMLGSALLAAPLLLGAVRLGGSLLRGLTLGARGTMGNPMIVQPVGTMGMGGMGGIGGGTFYKGGQFMPGGGRAPAGGTTVGGGGFMGRLPKSFSSKLGGNIGVGMGLGIAGTGLQALSQNMEPGDGASAVGVVGSMAQFGGAGAMFGPYGAIVGGLVGLTIGLANASKEETERRKADEAAKNEAEKKTQDLLEQLATRPLELKINNDNLGTLTTSQNQNSYNSNLY
jgi:hypothetical protein